MAVTPDPPPVPVEVWVRVGTQPTMHQVSTLEFPFPAPMDEEDLLLEFANQILESRKPHQNAGTGGAS